MIGSIEKVLSKEVDIQEKNLKKCFMQEVSVDFSGMAVLDSPNYIKCKNAVEEINKEIFKIREIILKKVNHPYTPIIDFESDQIDKLEQYELEFPMIIQSCSRLETKTTLITSKILCIGTLGRKAKH